MFAICAIYVVLGTAMEELSMILLTIPVFFPIVVGLGMDPVWFGIIIVVVVQIGLISPPVGMTLYVIQAVRREGNIKDVFAGTIPFVAAMVLMTAILIHVPSIATWIPRLLFGPS